MEKLEGNRPLGKPMSGWEDKVKMDLQEVVGAMSLIGLAQYRDRRRELAKAVMNIRVP